MSALDEQVGGGHYKDCKIQPAQYIEANDIRFLEGCVIKRCTRHNKPTGKGRQDIEKAIHELQLLLELRYGNQGTVDATCESRGLKLPAIMPHGATHYWPDYGQFFKNLTTGWARKSDEGPYWEACAAPMPSVMSKLVPV